MAGQSPPFQILGGLVPRPPVIYAHGGIYIIYIDIFIEQ